MPSRILREGILTSEFVNNLSPFAELFYRRLMSIVDDYGRSEAHPAILRAKCYPLQIDRVTEVDVSAWLQECASEKLVVLYTTGNKKYLEISKFNQRTRVDSKHPAPLPSSCQTNDSHNDGHGARSRASTPPPTPPTSSTEGGVGETELRTLEVSVQGGKLPIRDTGFERTIGAFLAAGVELNEQDLQEAAREWVSLDAGHHGPAAEAAEMRARDHEPRFMGMPANFLRKREWTRRGTGRLLPTPRAPTRAEEGQRRAAERFRAEMRAQGRE